MDGRSLLTEALLRDFVALRQGPLYDTLLKNHHPGFQRLDVRGDGLDYDAALLSQMDWSQ